MAVSILFFVCFFTLSLSLSLSVSLCRVCGKSILRVRSAGGGYHGRRTMRDRRPSARRWSPDCFPTGRHTCAHADEELSKSRREDIADEDRDNRGGEAKQKKKNHPRTVSLDINAWAEKSRGTNTESPLMFRNSPRFQSILNRKSSAFHDGLFISARVIVLRATVLL